MVFAADVHKSGFTVLYEAPGATIDIVFVHGFTGHPRDTWTLKSGKRPRQSDRAEEPTSSERPSKFPRLFSRAKSTASSSNASYTASRPNGASTLGCSIDPAASTHGSDVFWPADLLHHTVSTARVLTYGYDTRVKHWFQGQGSKNTVHDHAADLLSRLEARRRTASEISRPLLFIVHSLGGIVVKEALRQSKGWNLKPHLHNIFERTIGCVFFGTPHRGSDPRNAFHHIISSLVQGLGWKPNKQIVDTLMPNSERLASLREEFPVMCHERKWQVHSFQEEYGLAALLGTKVVDDSSSCLGDPIIEAREHIASNHMDMCRFHGLDDPGYRQVAAAITRIISSTQQSAQPDRPRQQPQLAHRSTQSTFQDQSLESDHVTKDVSDRHSPAMLNGAQPNPHISRGANDKSLRSELVQKLYFDKIDERLTGLSAAYGRTCCWFLEKPEYLSWLAEEHNPEHGGFLWIKGNPGTGKSTLLKFLFERAKESAKDDPSQIYLSFFFNARGDVDEKSTLGLYRSLLHQLFGHAPDLVESLEWMTLDGARGIQRLGWHEEALKQTLKHAIKVLGDRSLTIFVDALDECDQTQATDMVETFEELCELAQSLSIELRICFSSRHYPTITIQTGAELILEHETGHDEDIRTYIKSKLRLGKSKKSKQGETLRAEILEKSSGIFLWIVLVIEILNREFPQGSISQCRARLKGIPPKLHELFEMILKRDGDNLDQLRISFNLILFAMRPLKPQELYFAVQLGLDKNAPTHWDTDDISLDQMKSFVSTSSKGLAQVTRNKASEVQFIHESVRDFLLGKHGSQWSEAPENTEGCGHDMLKDCCLAQVQTSIPDLPEQLPKAYNSTELRSELTHKYPFLEYSIQHVFHHSDGAQRLGNDQSSFMSAFPLTAWVALNNALEQFDNRRYPKSVSLLYILAEKNILHLLAAHVDLARLCFRIGQERNGTPITAALATGSTDAARAMYSSIREYSSRHSALDALQHHLFSLCRVSQDNIHVLPRDFGTRKKAFRLQLIASENDPLLAHFLLHQTLFGSSRRDLINSALFWAAKKGDLDLATLVLSQGDNRTDSTDTFVPLATENFSNTSAELRLEGDLGVDAKDGNGWTPFWWAAKLGHKSIATLLLENGASICTKVRGEAPLWWAFTHSNNTMFQLLLELGADIEPIISRGVEPLLWAAKEKSASNKTIQLLLERGANLEVRDHFSGQTPLSYAAYFGSASAVQFLIDRGAEIETRDNAGRTPLLHAVTMGHSSSVQLLLDRGAEIETRDNAGRTPLLQAATRCHSSSVQLLLDRGAEIETRDNAGRTPLLHAVTMGHSSSVQLLLDRGAEIETRDHSGRTPLSWATNHSTEHMALFLLEKGAEIETRDNNGRTPLSWASSSFFSATNVLEVLLASGADPTSVDLEGKSPLDWAEKSKHSVKARLLRDTLWKLGRAPT